MSDYKYLIARLRDPYQAANIGAASNAMTDAADALEAQAAEIERLRAAAVVARDGYIAERATGQPVLETWRERTIEILDRALEDARNTLESKT